MTYNKRIPLLAGVLAVLLLTGCRPGYVQLTGYAQGGTWSVKYNAAGVKASPEAVQKGVEAILTTIDTTLSGYNKASLLSRLNAGERISPNRMLTGMYDYCHRLWEETGGALDIAAGPVFDVWGFGFSSDSLPDADRIADALARSGMGRLVPRMEDALDADGQLDSPRLIASAYDPGSIKDEYYYPRLNFNAVAQGYSCDTVASYLNSLGIKDMLVDIGEISCRGLNPSGKPWRVGVDRPTDGNDRPGADLDGIWESAGTLESQGIVTSGNYRKFYIKDGRKYSHTIDPRSGYPVEGSLLSATVVSKSAAAADAYATYCMVIGYEASKAFIESRPDLEGYLIYDEDGTMKEWASEGFTLYR